MNLIKYPNPLLKQISKPVTQTAWPIEKLEDFGNLLTGKMFEWKGIGLSAIQVGDPIRVFVMERENGNFCIFVNPEMEIVDSGPISIEEGCLSIPYFFTPVDRASKIKVTNFNGYPSYQYETILEGKDAIVFQHELDHLNGIIIKDKEHVKGR